MSKYQNFVAYYFSGTGNARNVATWMVNFAKSKNINTFLINIDRFKKVEIPKTEGKTLIGFFSPTHGFNLPPIMLEFMSKFPRSITETDVFIVNTRAGLKMNKLFIPGLSGLAQYFPSLILRLKGYCVVGQQPIDMPSNWISLHPGVRESVSVSMHERCKTISERVIDKLLSGKKVRKAWLSLPFDIAVSPVVPMYYFIGRFILAKTFVASDKCNLCGLCEKQCPVNAIIQVDKRMFWKYSCESCMRCMNQCPEKAIQTAHGFTTLGIWLASLVFTVLLTFLASKIDFFKEISELSDFVKGWVLYPIVNLTVFFLSYRFVHYLMRFTFFARLIEYTSFTKLPFWRRYKAKKFVLKKNLLPLSRFGSRVVNNNRAKREYRAIR